MSGELRVKSSQYHAAAPRPRPKHTPDINKPKLMGNRRHRGARLVGMTCQRLPGASRLMLPSARRTASRTKDDMMPRSEVRDRIRSGRKVVGTRLSTGKDSG